jgi:hypothetical protein
MPDHQNESKYSQAEEAAGLQPLLEAPGEAEMGFHVMVRLMLSHCRHLAIQYALLVIRSPPSRLCANWQACFPWLTPKNCFC